MAVKKSANTNKKNKLVPIRPKRLPTKPSQLVPIKDKLVPIKDRYTKGGSAKPKVRERY